MNELMDRDKTQVSGCLRLVSGAADRAGIQGTSIS